MKLYETLENQLKKENNFVTDEGELKKWVVIGKARNYDPVLIKLLLENDTLKEKFFVEVEGTLVFKQEEFITFMEMKNYLNDSYTQYKNKVGLTIDGKYLKQRNEVALVWPYKDCVLEGGQTKEEQKREEIFFNEILAQDEITQLFEPKVLTNAKVYDKDGVHNFTSFTRDAELNRKRGLPEDTITDNLIIKGNNLLALHSLKKEFAGKVKLIYIDPPYNTGNDGFNYNDGFNHSTWLTFMKNRLEVAKKLLKEDGIIFIQIDDREHAYLKILMDEVFGRENFISSIAIKVKAPSGVATGGLIFDVKENVLMYARYDKSRIKPVINKIQKEVIDECSETIKSYNFIFIDEGEIGEIVNTLETSTGIIEIRKHNKYKIKKIDFTKINDVAEYYVRNFSKIFRTASLSGGIEKKIKKLIRDNELYSYYHIPSKGKHTGRKMKYYIYKKEQILWLNNTAKIEKLNRRNLPIKFEQISNIITLNLWQGISKEGNVSLKSGKKPEQLIKLLVELVTKPKDIVLDFFLGSGTTSAVAHKMDRQYIGIEQLDYGENSAVIRLKNVINGDQTGISEDINWQGGGNFVYLELKKYNQAFIEKIQKAKTTDELLAIWEQMKERSFLNYNVDLKKQEEHIEEFKQLSVEEQKQHLVEILDKNQLYVNLSSINDKDFEVSEEEKQVTKDFYQIKKD